jgi:hypothetical protein
MSEIPWWGWLIIAIVALVVLYYFAVLLFVGKVARTMFHHDDFPQLPPVPDQPRVWPQPPPFPRDFGDLRRGYRDPRP